VFEGVGFGGEGEDVEDREEGHFNAEEDGGNADVDVGVVEGFGWLEGSA